MSTKNWVWFICLVLILPIFFWHLLMDDDLEPKAQEQLELLSRQPNLSNNAFIKMMSLEQQQSDNDDELNISKYLETQAQFQAGNLEMFHHLKFPQINDLESIEKSPFLCDLEAEPCRALITNSYSTARELIRPWLEILERYLHLSEIDNWQVLNPAITNLNLDQLATLSKIAGLDIFLDTINNMPVSATAKLNQLLKLHRIMLSINSNIILKVVAIVEFKIRYLPLIIELAKLNQVHWEDTLLHLEPLNISAFSNQKYFMNEFYVFTQMIRNTEFSKKNKSQLGLIGKLKSSLVYKENMTINQHFSLVDSDISVESINKSQLANYLKQIKQETDVRNLQLTKDSENMLWFAIKNYRNVVGSIMGLTAIPRYMEFSEDIMLLDLQLLLARLVIHNVSSPIDKLIQNPSYKNPFDGTSPYFLNNKICYEHLQKETCVPLHTD